MNCREAAALVVNDTRVEAVTAPTTNARSPLEKPLSELREEDIAQVTREDCRRFLKERGMRRPSWNKSQAIQQVISLKALLEGRPGAGDPPVSSFLLPSKSPHDPTPSHDARSSEKNETSCSGGSVPLLKEPLLSPYRRRDPVLNTPVVVMDAEAYTYDEEVIKKAEAMGKPGLVEIYAKEDSFIFTVESTGAIKAPQLVINAIKVLQQKLDAVRLQDDNNFNELDAHLGGS